MTHPPDTAAPSLRRAATGALSALLALALAGPPATAGPIDQALRWERLGDFGDAGIVKVLPAAGLARALVVHRDGALTLASPEGIAEPVGQVDGMVLGPHAGLLDAAWIPGAEGEELCLSYVELDGSFVVARLALGEAAPTVLWRHPRPTPVRERLGGCLAFASDGTLLVGIGDFGAPERADAPSQSTGVLLRMTLEGRPPGPPLSPNPVATECAIAFGLRDPFRASFDARRDSLWLLDGGEPAGEELNLLPLGRDVLADFGWGAERMSGPDAPGSDPPVFWWPLVGEPAPADLHVIAGRGLRDERLDRLLTVEDSASRIHVWNPVGGTWYPTEIVEPDPSSPAGFASIAELPNGEHAFVSGDGEAFRLRWPEAAPRESSGVDSLLPLTVRRERDGSFTLEVERTYETGELGLWYGDLESLPRGGLPVAGEPDLVLLPGPADGDARTPVALDRSQIVTPSRSAWFLVDASNRAGTWGRIDLGDDSFGVLRPGSVPDCDPWSGTGTLVGHCVPEFVSPLGVRGPAIFTDHAFPGDIPARQVISISFGAVWCGPSVALSDRLAAFHRDHSAEGYEHVDVLFEDLTGQPPNRFDLEDWRDRFGALFTILADPDALVADEWFSSEGRPDFPQTWVVDRNGVVVSWTLGNDPSAIEADILAALVD